MVEKESDIRPTTIKHSRLTKLKRYSITPKTRPESNILSSSESSDHEEVGVYVSSSKWINVNEAVRKQKLGKGKSFENKAVEGSKKRKVRKLDLERQIGGEGTQDSTSSSRAEKSTTPIGDQEQNKCDKKNKKRKHDSIIENNQSASEVRTENTIHITPNQAYQIETEPSNSVDNHNQQNSQKKRASKKRKTIISELQDQSLSASNNGQILIEESSRSTKRTKTNKKRKLENVDEELSNKVVQNVEKSKSIEEVRESNIPQQVVTVTSEDRDTKPDDAQTENHQSGDGSTEVSQKKSTTDQPRTALDSTTNETRDETAVTTQATSDEQISEIKKKKKSKNKKRQRDDPLSIDPDLENGQAPEESKVLKTKKQDSKKCNLTVEADSLTKNADPESELEQATANTSHSTPAQNHNDPDSSSLKKKERKKNQRLANPANRTSKYQMSSDDPALITSRNSHLFDETTQFSDKVRESLMGLPQNEILATRWLSAKQLQELVDVFGLKYKKGVFNAQEVEVMNRAVKAYQTLHHLTEEEMREVIMSKRSEKPLQGDSERNFSLSQEIASQLPGRSVVAVWKKLIRSWHSCSKMGKWQIDEDNRLIEGVTRFGSSWVKVGELVGRMADDCKDRWNKVLCVKINGKNGTWSIEETEKLKSIMLKLLGNDANNVGEGEPEVIAAGLWGTVSRLMGGQRSERQCREKWTESLKRKMSGDGELRSWKHRDVLTLLQQLSIHVAFLSPSHLFSYDHHSLMSLSFRMTKHEMNDEFGFDWKVLIHPGWDHWTPRFLHRRWKQIKKYYLRKIGKQSEPTVKELLKEVLKIWSQKTDAELDQVVMVRGKGKQAERVNKKDNQDLQPNNSASNKDMVIGPIVQETGEVSARGIEKEVERSIPRKEDNVSAREARTSPEESTKLTANNTTPSNNRTTLPENDPTSPNKDTLPKEKKTTALKIRKEPIRKTKKEPKEKVPRKVTRKGRSSTKMVYKSQEFISDSDDGI
ncbi:hypothetical protein CROQUDRAFT_111203 [Cronartium quercuum f. sp. fusiforme G11]|uniref:Uncharacterized protein n=1 Tax=Cronartium quercuum f. sp. fusiforme G11 TaxID=708437 RepID=A0A9P6N677_9BASI|nr:hypothetical protein CROQUDRAFT_111203 [Cronartium quercuum f. sp. fusiforme G11]